MKLEKPDAARVVPGINEILKIEEMEGHNGKRYACQCFGSRGVQGCGSRKR